MTLPRRRVAACIGSALARAFLVNEYWFWQQREASAAFSHSQYPDMIAGCLTPPPRTWLDGFDARWAVLGVCFTSLAGAVFGISAAGVPLAAEARAWGRFVRSSAAVGLLLGAATGAWELYRGMDLLADLSPRIQVRDVEEALRPGLEVMTLALLSWGVGLGGAARIKFLRRRARGLAADR